MLTRDWRKYNGRQDVVFRPRHMSTDTLLEGYRYANRRFYSAASIGQRLFRSPVGAMVDSAIELSVYVGLFFDNTLGAD